MRPAVLVVLATIPTLGVGYQKVSAYSERCRIEAEKEAEHEERTAENNRQRKLKRREMLVRERDEKRTILAAAEARNWIGDWGTLRDDIRACKNNYGLIRHTLQSFKTTSGCTNHSLTREAYLELTKLMRIGKLMEECALSLKLEVLLADSFLECVDVGIEDDKPSTTLAAGIAVAP